MNHEEKTERTPPAQPSADQPSAPESGGEKAQEPPQEDRANQEIQAGFGPFGLRDEEIRYYTAVAGEAHQLAAETPRDPSRLAQALVSAAKALERVLEGYEVLRKEYLAIDAECQTLMNRVRQDQDRSTGPLGAGGRFVPPEEVAGYSAAVGSEPPPLPNHMRTRFPAPSTTGAPKKSAVWVSEIEKQCAEFEDLCDRQAKRIRELEDEVSGVNEHSEKLTEVLNDKRRESEQLRFRFLRYALQQSGLDREDWELIER